MIKYPLNVTIDSNIFFENNYDLGEESTLSHLVSYVEKGKIKVFMSNIVVNEILRQIKNKAYGIRAIINNSRKELRGKYPESLIKSVDMGHILKRIDRDEMALKAQSSLNEFLKKLDVTYLDNSGVDVEKIFCDYFSFNPPFEDNNEKRKEFPDAFITAQIRMRFKNGEKLAIVSKDNGFKKACGTQSGYIFFDSLGKLYDRLAQEEKDYDECIKSIKNLNDCICDEIKDTILENDCVDVIGVSYDRDGVEHGYDYSETYVDKVSNVSIRIHTIDEINEEHVFATLICSADIDVDCYYEDYDSAVWDSKSKSYLFLESKRNKEIHKARFGVRLDLNKDSEEFKLSEFKVELGGDSRKAVFDMTEYEKHKQYIMDMDRECAGLIAIREYENHLEEMLANSKMHNDFVSKFETINTILSKFEDISVIYDEIIERIKESSDDAKKILLKVLDNKENIEDFSLDLDVSNITEEDISKFIVWMEEKYQEVSKFDNNERLPDYVEFGDRISFSDANDNTYILSLDEIQLSLTEGETEYINMNLSNDSNSEMHKGYIELTVGYVNYDEEGGVADGLADNIEFHFDAIINRIEEVVNGLRDLLDRHNKLKESLESLL